MQTFVSKIYFIQNLTSMLAHLEALYLVKAKIEGILTLKNSSRLEEKMDRKDIRL